MFQGDQAFVGALDKACTAVINHRLLSSFTITVPGQKLFSVFRSWNFLPPTRTLKNAVTSREIFNICTCTCTCPLIIRKPSRLAASMISLGSCGCLHFSFSLGSPLWILQSSAIFPSFFSPLLNSFTFLASLVAAGSLFQPSTTRWLKKCPP